MRPYISQKKERDYRALLWYVLVPALYFFAVPWAVSGFFSGMMAAM